MNIKNKYLKQIAHSLSLYGVHPQDVRSFTYPSPNEDGRDIPCEVLWYVVHAVPYSAIEAMTFADDRALITVRIFWEPFLDKLGDMPNQFLINERSDFPAQRDLVVELGKRIFTEASWPIVLSFDVGAGTIHNASDKVVEECFGATVYEHDDVDLRSDKGMTVREFVCGCAVTRPDGKKLWNHQRHPDCKEAHIPKEHRADA